MPYRAESVPVHLVSATRSTRASHLPQRAPPPARPREAPPPPSRCRPPPPRPARAPHRPRTSSEQVVLENRERAGRPRRRASEHVVLARHGLASPRPDTASGVFPDLFLNQFLVRIHVPDPSALPQPCELDIATAEFVPLGFQIPFSYGHI
jgi:hypothetical protein